MIYPVDQTLQTGSWWTREPLWRAVNTVQFHSTFCYRVASGFLILVQYSVITRMVCCMFWDEELGGQRKLHCVSLHWYNCTEGERHAGGSNHPSEDFETHTRLRHMLYSSNSLCVHRLQVQHCMLVWDWQLCPPHCSLEYVQHIWVQYWTVSLVWKRDRNSGHVYMHRELLFLLFFTWLLTLLHH